MENLIYIIPVIVIIYIVYIIVKYNGIEPYEKTHMEYYRDKNFTELSPIVWSYIIRKRFKKRTVIANVLLYVKKGYISMTKKNEDYEFKIVKSIAEINKLDLWAMVLFFRNKTSLGTVQYLSNFNRYMWIEKNFGSYSHFQKEADGIIKASLSENKIINYVDEKINKRNIIFSYFSVIVILIMSATLSANITDAIGFVILFLVGYSILVQVVEKSNYMLLAHGAIFFSAYFGMGTWNVYSLALIVTSILTFILIYMDDKFLRVKGKNGEVIEKALGLKRYIRDFSNIKEYGLEYLNLWDEYYIYSIALGMNKIIT